MKTLLRFFIFLIILTLSTPLFADREEIIEAHQRWQALLREYYNRINHGPKMSKKEHRQWGIYIHQLFVDVWEEMAKDEEVIKVDKTFHGKDGNHVYRSRDYDPANNRGFEIWVEKEVDNRRFRADYVKVNFETHTVEVSDITTRSLDDAYWSNFDNYERGSRYRNDPGAGAAAADHEIRNRERALAIDKEIEKWREREERKTNRNIPRFRASAKTPEELYYRTDAERKGMIRSLSNPPDDGARNTHAFAGGLILNFVLQRLLDLPPMDDGSESANRTLAMMIKLYLKGDVTWADYIRKHKWEAEEEGSIYVDQLIEAEGWSIGIHNLVLDAINAYLDKLREAAIRASKEAKERSAAILRENQVPATPVPTGPVSFTNIPANAVVQLDIANTSPLFLLCGDSISFWVRTMVLTEGYWLPVKDAPMIVRWYSGNALVHQATASSDANGLASFSPVPTNDKPGYYRIEFSFEGRQEKKEVVLETYDYVVMEGAPLLAAESRADGKDSIRLNLELKKRFRKPDNGFRYETPFQYTHDFKSIGISGRFLSFSRDGVNFRENITLSPSADHGAFRLLARSTMADIHEVILDARGGKFKRRFVELGRFKLSFKDHPVNYYLRWGDVMNPFVQGDQVKFPVVEGDALQDFPLQIFARYKSNDQPVEGARVQITLQPANGVELAYHTSLMTNETGEALSGDRKPLYWRAKAPRTEITITAPGASNTLTAIAVANVTDRPVVTLELPSPSPTNLRINSKTTVTGRVVLPEGVTIDRYAVTLYFPGDATVVVDADNFVQQPIAGRMAYDETFTRVKPNKNGTFRFDVQPGSGLTFPMRVTVGDNKLNEIIIEKIIDFEFFNGPTTSSLGTIAGKILARSTFNQGTEGWQMIHNGDLTQPALASGALMGHEGAANITWLWKAPASFIGTKSAAYGGYLVFDMYQQWTDGGFSEPDVVLKSGELELGINLPEPPGNTWKRYEVPLQHCASWTNLKANRKATAEELQHALDALDELLIRGEFRIGDDRSWLDNVAIISGNPVHGKKIFSRIAQTNSSIFKPNTMPELDIPPPNNYDRTPYKMASFDTVITRKPDDRVVLAGSAQGTAGWFIDNFMYYEISYGSTTNRFVSGWVHTTVTYRGQPIPAIYETGGYNRSADGHQTVTDITQRIPPQRPVRIVLTPLDYGIVGEMSDVFLVIGGVPSESCQIKVTQAGN